MSYEVVSESGALGQFASNSGYADLIAATDDLALVNLFETGESDDVEQVQLGLAKIKSPADVASTASTLSKLIDGSKSILITDGVTGTEGIEKSEDLGFIQDEVVAKTGNGIMVSLQLDPGTASKLVVPDGEKPEDLHITLAYFGKLVDIDVEKLPKLESALAAFAALHAPLSGTFGGPGRFNASEYSDGKDVVFAQFESKDIQSFRSDLIDCLEAVGVEARNNFGYTPHTTLAYIEPDADLPVQRIEPLDFTFDKVSLSIGGARKDYFLTGEPVEKGGPGSEAGFKSIEKPSSEFELVGEIIKLDKHRQLCFGWFSIVEVDGKPLTDTQGDIISEETIENSAYDFVLNARKGGEMHQTNSKDEVRGVGRLVESVVFTKEKQKAMLDSLIEQGIDAVLDLKCIAWWGGFFVEDLDTWSRITTGKLRAWSIGGAGKRGAQIA